MFAVKELHVRQPIIEQSALVSRDTLVTHLLAVDNLRREICVSLVPVDLELNVEQGLIDLELTGQCVPVQLDTEEIL